MPASNLPHKHASPEFVPSLSQQGVLTLPWHELFYLPGFRGALEYSDSRHKLLSHVF
jgi:hypothetical protein